jgi:hypothetical protein
VPEVREDRFISVTVIKRMSDDELDNVSYDSKRSIATFFKIACTSRNLLIPAALPYSQVKRLILTDEEDDSVVVADEECDDELAEVLVESASGLSFTERVGNSEVSVDVMASLATLFDRDSAEARALKPRLFLAYAIRDNEAEIKGILTCCNFERDPSISTQRFTQAYCTQHDIPRLSNALLIDCVASTRESELRGTGALLVLAACIACQRSKTLDLICTVAVTTAGKRLFQVLGFNEHKYREGTPRSLFWVRPNELRAIDIQRRLRWDPSVQAKCWRRGMQQRTQNTFYPRC